MLSAFARVVTNFVYRVGSAVRRFEATHPDEKVLAAGATKMVRADPEAPIRRGAEWITARRTVVILSDRRLSARGLDVPLEQIARARLVRVGFALVVRGGILEIVTKGGECWRFGLQDDSAWVEQKALPLTVEQGRLGHSLVSVLARVLLILVILNWLLEWSTPTPEGPSPAATSSSRR